MLRSGMSWTAIQAVTGSSRAAIAKVAKRAAWPGPMADGAEHRRAAVVNSSGALTLPLYPGDDRG